jgi:hypothetical protein
MHKRNILNSPRLLELKNKRRKIIFRKILIIAIGLVLAFGVLSYISRLSKLNITGVNVEGNKVIDSEAIVKIVNKETSGKYLWLFPKTNILLYPKNKIRLSLGNEFKRLTNIDIETKDKKIIVSVEEREPSYTWCGNMPPTNQQEGAKETCYFLDKDGYIFDEAPYFSGEVYFKFYGLTGKDDGPSGAYLAHGFFDRLIDFKDSLSSMNLKPVMLYLEEGKNAKIFLTKKSSTINPEIRFKKDSDFKKIATNFKAALDTEPLLSKFKNEYSKLEYVDLRFGNKVYYKFK